MKGTDLVTKKSTKKTPRGRRPRARKPEATDQLTEADTPGTVATGDEALATASAPAASADESTKAPRRRGSRKPRKTTDGDHRKPTEAPGETTATLAGPGESKAEIKEADGTIVIRFPAVAPPPFPTRLPTLDVPAVTKRSPASAAPPVAPPATLPPPPLPETPTEAALEPESEVAEAPPAAAPGPPTRVGGPETGQPHLSRSQRRRLRRKRRREASGATPAPSQPRRPTPEARRPRREDLPEPPPREEGPTAAYNGVTGLAGEQEELPPWLEDAAAARAETFANGTDHDELEPEAPAAELADNGDEAAALAAPTDEERDAGAPSKEKGRRRRRRGGRRSRHDTDENHRGGAAVAVVGEEAEAEPTVESKPVAGRREMIINTVQREECRIAILCDGRLEEIYLERAAAENHVGNIYKGVITNVEPSIQAAFVDFGQGKNGFLHISDLHPQYFPDGGSPTENVGRKMPRRNRPPIQRCLRRGQQVLVQVTKEGIGTKGPTLSTYLSIPGRFLVMMPGMRRLGVSRRIEDDTSRDKLRDVLAELELPEGMGFIARTAALDRTKRELQNDLSYLTRLWRAVEKRIQNEAAPAELYRESDLVIRTIRDVFTNDIERIVVDDADVAERAREFLSIFSPRSQDLVVIYTDPEPIFHKYKIEAELERLHSRHVPLKSGGSLVIDQTEAMVAIDVNSGRFRTEDDAEATAYKINCEAADEIPRQLRLRDLGGVIVCDFIDMRLESHRRDIERRLIENLKKHKERAKVLRTSSFGLIEMTRQRQRASLTRSIYRDCRHCRGTGLVKTTESVVLDVMRLLQLAVTREHIRMVEVAVSPEVSYLLQNRKRALIHELETKYRRSVSIRPDPNFSLDQVEITCTDARGRVVPHM